MSPKAKVWMYGVAFSVSLALYAPRFLGEDSSRQDESLDLAANAELEGEDFEFDESFEGEGAGTEDSFMDANVPATRGAGGSNPLDTGVSQNAGLAGGSDLQRALERLDNFTRRPADESLDELSLGLAEIQTVTSTNPMVETSSAAGTDTSAARRRSMAEARKRTESYLSRNPVRGILRGAHGDLALVGDRQVSVGDVLPDCGARVTAIEAGGVRLDCQGQELFAELPPLRVLRRQTSSQRSDSAAFDQLELEAQSASYLENDR